MIVFYKILHLVSKNYLNFGCVLIKDLMESKRKKLTNLTVQVKLYQTHGETLFITCRTPRGVSNVMPHITQQPQRTTFKWAQIFLWHH